MTYPDAGARLQRFVWGSFRQTVTVNRLNGFSFDTEVLYQGIRFRIVANLFKPTFILSFEGWRREVGPRDISDEDWETYKRELEKQFPGIKLPVQNPSPKPTRKK
jgi:hypothetical protein